MEDAVVVTIRNMRSDTADVFRLQRKIRARHRFLRKLVAELAAPDIWFIVYCYYRTIQV